MDSSDFSTVVLFFFKLCLLCLYSYQINYLICAASTSFFLHNLKSLYRVIVFQNIKINLLKVLVSAFEGFWEPLVPLVSV